MGKGGHMVEENIILDVVGRFGHVEPMATGMMFAGEWSVGYGITSRLRG